MLRTNHSTWPVDVSQIKQGFIVVKGHSTVSLPSRPTPLCPSSILWTHSCPDSFSALCPWDL